jgi:hypothetical protein
MRRREFITILGTIMAQLEGRLIFGLTAALWGEVNHRQGPRASIELQRLPHFPVNVRGKQPLQAEEA